VNEHTREVDGRRARVWGWNYHTLEGHLEIGQMDWEVWKWLESGEVEFHVHSVSLTARIANPLIRVGFWLLKGHGRDAFLTGTRTRMRTLIELTLEQQGPKKPASSSYAR
jgi:hypothetical protein